MEGDRFDFDEYLAKGVPSRLAVSVVNGSPKNSRLHPNKELKGVDKPVAMPNLHLVDRYSKGDEKRWLRGKYQPIETGKDLLADNLFEMAHRRKEAEERKFAVADRIRMLSEFEDCMDAMVVLGREVKTKARLTLKEQFTRILKQPLTKTELASLAKTLPELTKINDASDLQELEIKYRMTVRELQRFIVRWDEVKSREQRVKRLKEDRPKKTKRMTAYQLKEWKKRQAALIDTDEEEPSDPADMDQFKRLKKVRKSRRNRKYGAVIKVNFYDGVVLVIDPIERPRVEQLRGH